MGVGVWKGSSLCSGTEPAACESRSVGCCRVSPAQGGVGCAAVRGVAAGPCRRSVAGSAASCVADRTFLPFQNL